MMRNWWESLIHRDNIRSVRIAFHGMEETELQSHIIAHNIGDTVSVGMERSDVGTAHWITGIVVGVSLSDTVKYDVAFVAGSDRNLLCIAHGVQSSSIQSMKESMPKRKFPALLTEMQEDIREEAEPEELSPLSANTEAYPDTFLDHSFYDKDPRPQYAKPASLMIAGLSGSSVGVKIDCPFQIGDSVTLDLTNGGIVLIGVVVAIHIGQGFSFDVAFRMQGTTMRSVGKRIPSEFLTPTEE